MSAAGLSVSFVAKGEGPRTVMLLHGIGAGAEMFSPQIDGLSDRFRVVAWNMPGYGGNPLGLPMTFEGLSAALLGLCDRLGVSRVDLLGHSIGGMIAQDFVGRHPERVRTLVLSATTAAFGSRDGNFQKRFVAERLAPLDEGRSMAALAEAFVPGLVGSRSEPSAIALAKAGMSAVPANTYREVIRCLATFNGRDSLPKIAVPTLLIAGDEDRNAPAPTMQKMAAKITGARFECLPGVDHLAPLEQPDAYNALLKRFFDDHPGGETQ